MVTMYVQHELIVSRVTTYIYMYTVAKLIVRKEAPLFLQTTFQNSVTTLVS